MKPWLIVIIIIVTVLFHSSRVFGAVVVSQTPVSGGGVSRTSQLWQDPSPAGNNLDGDSVCWEDFTLSATTAINHLEWWGNGACELGFQIEFWKQDPGTVAYQPLGLFYYGQGNPPVSPEPPGFITVIPVTSTGPGGLTHYSVDLPNTVTMAANDAVNPRWFVGIVGLTSAAYASWNWAQGTGGSGHTFHFIRGGTLAGGDLFQYLPEGRALLVSGTVAEPPQPMIYLDLIGVDQVQLAWRTNYTGYVLETASALPVASWQPVTNSVTTAGQQYSVTVGVAASSGFFRLRKN